MEKFVNRFGTIICRQILNNNICVYVSVCVCLCPSSFEWQKYRCSSFKPISITKLIYGRRVIIFQWNCFNLVIDKYKGHTCLYKQKNAIFDRLIISFCYVLIAKNDFQNIMATYISWLIFLITASQTNLSPCKSERKKESLKFCRSHGIIYESELFDVLDLFDVLSISRSCIFSSSPKTLSNLNRVGIFIRFRAIFQRWYQQGSEHL